MKMMRFSTAACVATLLTTGLVACSDSEPNNDNATDAGPNVSPDSGTTANNNAVASNNNATTGNNNTNDNTISGGPVSMFVAQGHSGRTTISCDDGQTWVANRSDDDNLVCFLNGGVDCDHHGGTGRGIIAADGWFFTTYGWEQPGSIRRSQNGVDWETVVDGITFISGLAYDGTNILAGGRPASMVSTDLGSNWSDVSEIGLDTWNVRRVGYSSFDGGRFVMVAEDFAPEPSIQVAVSSDGGLTWFNPDSIAATCGARMQTSGGIVEGNGVWLMVGRNGLACRSTDGGQNWTDTSVGGEITSHLLWTGSQFMVWSRGMVYSSPDGASWSSQPIMPANLELGGVAVNDNGTFVGVNNGWEEWYDRQVFYRSSDGVNWTEATSYTKSHPIAGIVFGGGQASSACPE